MATIYILTLEGGKYYVGKSNQHEARIHSHFSSAGGAWTRAHKPTKIYGTYPSTDNHDEDVYTIKMMHKFGIDNVRGGMYSKIVLDAGEIASIKKSIASATDACFRCYKKGHSIHDCKATHDRYGDLIFDPPSKEHCEKCLSDGHKSDECIAKVTVNGDPIKLADQNFQSTRKRNFQQINTPSLSSASNKPNIFDIIHQDKKQRKYSGGRDSHASDSCYASFHHVCCSRCGRDSHTSKSCYASFHRDGYEL